MLNAKWLMTLNGGSFVDTHTHWQRTEHSSASFLAILTTVKFPYVVFSYEQNNLTPYHPTQPIAWLLKQNNVIDHDFWEPTLPLIIHRGRCPSLHHPYPATTIHNFCPSLLPFSCIFLKYSWKDFGRWNKIDVKGQLGQFWQLKIFCWQDIASPKEVRPIYAHIGVCVCVYLYMSFNYTHKYIVCVQINVSINIYQYLYVNF